MIVDESNGVEELTIELVEFVTGTVLMDEGEDGLQKGGLDQYGEGEYNSNVVVLDVELEAVIGPTGDDSNTLE